MKLMAIDGNSLVNRAYYGVRPLSARDGTPTNALYGFLNMYAKLAEDHKPDAVCVCFDLKAKTFRHEMYDGYKAGRKPMPDELAAQMPLVKEALDLMGISRMELEGYEADDLLGTLAARSRESGDECVIVTGDRDSLQYVAQGAKVALVTTRMGLTQTEVYDEALFAEKYNGMTADKIVDLKAIMGDKSDNIPGVPGIGEKGAMELLGRFGSLEGIYDNLEQAELTPSVRKKLTEGRDMAFLSYKLALGVIDAPLEKGPRDLLLRPMDEGGLFDFLNRLELRSIIKRLGLTPSASNKTAASSFEEREWERVDSAEKLAKILEGPVAVAFSDDMSGVALARHDGVYYTDSGLIPQLGDIMAEYLSRQGCICHDGKTIALWMYCRGAEPAAPAFDTAIAAYLMAPSANDFSLESVALPALNAPLNEHEEEGQLTMGAPDDGGAKALARRAQIIYALKNHYEPLLVENGMTDLFNNIELPLIPVLAYMQHEGMRLDSDRLRAFGNTLSGEIKSLEDRIYQLAGHEFNISSTRQLGQVLYDEMGLKAGKKTKTGYSTDAETLEKLRDNEIVGLVLDYRKHTKLMSTYVDGLLKVVCPDGRVRSSFNQTVTATGRLSSTDPNMQNIPVRNELGSEIRRCFIPEEGWVFLDADYSQIELRVLAHIAGDENMREAFAGGEDIHTVTASQVFGVPISEVTHEMRSRAKAVNFGIVYGISAFSLSEDIGVYPKQAQQYIDTYLERFHGVRRYMENIKKQAHEDGYVTSAFGRRRWVPELRSSNFNTRAFGERVALNTPIQGTAADIIKIAMINVFKALREAGLKARLILQVHDELIVECPAGEAERASEILGREMENAVRLSVAMRAEVSRGDNWYDAKN